MIIQSHFRCLEVPSTQLPGCVVFSPKCRIFIILGHNPVILHPVTPASLALGRIPHIGSPENGQCIPDHGQRTVNVVAGTVDAIGSTFKHRKRSPEHDQRSPGHDQRNPPTGSAITEPYPRIERYPRRKRYLLFRILVLSKGLTSKVDSKVCGRHTAPGQHSIRAIRARAQHNNEMGAIRVRPRLEIVSWSLYWKEPLFVKTECLEDTTIEGADGMTGAELLEATARQLGWRDVNSLVRIEGFAQPWQRLLIK